MAEKIAAWRPSRRGAGCLRSPGADPFRACASEPLDLGFEEFEQIRVILQSRFEELDAEYEEAVAQNTRLRLVEIGDAAGDDQADSGSKTAERDAASSLIRTLLDRRTQAEHAMQRLEDGTYGNCEGCSKPIPVERLAVFPSATSCVACKSNRERRAG